MSLTLARMPSLSDRELWLTLLRDAPDSVFPSGINKAKLKGLMPKNGSREPEVERTCPATLTGSNANARNRVRKSHSRILPSPMKAVTSQCADSASWATTPEFPFSIEQPRVNLVPGIRAQRSEPAWIR